MASSIIHMAITSEINKKIKRNEKNIFLGTIAPDISKLIGESKEKSHFLTNNDDEPDLNKFLSIYKENLDDDFVLGYYIHLFTDYIWTKYFITDYIKDSYVYDINDNKINLSKEKIVEYIYNDYTNMNSKIIDKYNLNISLFQEKTPEFERIIQEIPMNKIDLMIEKLNSIIKNNKETKPHLFNIESIFKFITFCVEVILDNLKDLKVYKY